MRILEPRRANYQTKFSDGGKCVFCDITEMLECPSLSGKHWRVIVNQFPYMDGNVMLVPIRHIDKIEDVNEDEWLEFSIMLVKIKEILGAIFKTTSFNFALNIGPESGASIPHIHWQVIPRKLKNVNALNIFADLYVVKVSPEETKRLIDEVVNGDK